MRARATAEVLRPEPMTLEAWADLDEDVPGEFRDGRLMEEEPSNLHELIVAWMIRVLGNWAVPRRYIVLGSGHKLGVAPDRGRKPDVCMYPPGTHLGARASHSRTPPALIEEILPPRARDVRRDRLEKLEEYAKFGVRWYWLLDPEARVLEMLRLGSEGQYVRERSVGKGQVDVPGFEGLTLDGSALWAKADELLADEEEDGTETGWGSVKRANCSATSSATSG